MRNTLIALALAGLTLSLAPVNASAAPIVPLSKSAICGPSNITDARWRRCWRDRWGRTRCQWCWRDRWGRVICR
jgi:hypothetical protein